MSPRPLNADAKKSKTNSEGGAWIYSEGHRQTLRLMPRNSAFYQPAPSDRLLPPVYPAPLPLISDDGLVQPVDEAPTPPRPPSNAQSLADLEFHAPLLTFARR